MKTTTVLCALLSLACANSYGGASGKREFKVITPFEQKQVSSSNCSLKVVREVTTKQYDSFSGTDDDESFLDAYEKAVQADGPKFDYGTEFLTESQSRAMTYKAIKSAFEKKGYSLKAFTENTDFVLVEYPMPASLSTTNGRSNSVTQGKVALTDSGSMNDLMLYIETETNYPWNYYKAVKEGYVSIVANMPRCVVSE